MAVSKQILIAAFFITAFLFVSILLISNLFDDKRQEYIDEQMQKTYNQLNEMQLYLLLSETYGNEMACLAFEKKLRDLDTHLWNLGRKIERYRSASEEFTKDPYYLEQKKVFNENEIFYLLLLTKLKRECDLNQVIISFFYINSADCRKCDDQSFVLTDLNRELDEEIAIFSFDLDLNLTSLNLLTEYYNISEYPCIVIDEQPYCGMLDRSFIEQRICEVSNVSIC